MANEKILFVDDEPYLLQAIRRRLRDKYEIETAESGEKALEIISEKGPFAVVVSDMRMPEMNGVEFLRKVQERSPNCVRLMLTGNADQDTAVRAVNESNIYRFLTKPCPPEALIKAIDDAQAQYRLITAERELLQDTLSGSIRVLTEVLGLVDPSAFGRALPVREEARKIAQQLAIENAWELEIASMLCFIGTLALPDSLVDKIAMDLPLSKEEQMIVDEVPQTSSRLLQHIPRLGGVSEIVLYHRKGFDGSGLPKDSRAGEDLPLGARILHILFDVQNMVSKGMSRQDALLELAQRRGKYDPSILAILIPQEQQAEALVPQKPIAIKYRDLKPGQLLSSPIETLSGLTIVRENTRLNAAMIQRIENFARISGVREPIFIFLGESEKQQEEAGDELKRAFC